MIIEIKDDFSLEKIVFSGQCFRAIKFEENGYFFIQKGNLLIIRQISRTTFDVNKGIGIKVANCIALFSYGQFAAVPVDTWINKIITEKYHGKGPFTRYGDIASLVQQYAFYYAINHKEEFTNV